MPARTRLAGAAHSDVVAIFGPALLALVLSLIGITGRSLGFDEGATWAIASQHLPGHGLGAGIAHDGGNMLGFYALEHLLIAAFGDSLFVLRLPAVLSAPVTAGFVAAIGLRLFERRVAVLGAVLTAVTLSVVYWQQTARGYAPMLAFTCAGMLCFVLLANGVGPSPDGQPAPRRWPGARWSWPAGRWWPVAGYSAAMALAIYCSFVAVLVIPAQVVALVWRRSAWRRFLVALVGLAVCAVPLAVLARRRGSGQLFWVPRPDHQVEKQVLESLTGSGLQSVFHPTFLATPGYWLTIAAVAAVLVTALIARSRAAAQPSDAPLAGWGALLVLAWAIVPPVLVFGYSFASQPLFQPRNLLTSVPGVAFVLALGICDRRLPRRAAGAALVVALGIRLVPLATSYDVSPEPWDAATHAVLSSARPGDCVLFYPEDGHNPFQYYEHNARPAGASLPRSVLPSSGWPEIRSYVERYETLTPTQQTALAARCRRLWLVSSHEGQSNGPPQSRRNLRTFNRFRGELERVFGHGPVKTYGYASAIHVRLLPGRG
ncbi:MAG TPA: glycosyltransferase family 39 protein [Solirubrobacteraceae bacterium]|nr:glycosyltransferase family 39 protein [Solirubrobacteraceae bacterium]